MHGVSWGSTLALAYTLAHPTRVTELVLVAVTTGARREIDWITEDVGAVFPEAWAQLAGSLPLGVRGVDHCAALLRDPDPTIRAAAAHRRDEWESTHVSLDPNWKPGPLHEGPRHREYFATLVTHYLSNDCFLEDDEIIGRAGELASTPGVLIHGRHDISGRIITPWLLHNAWPGSRLTIVESEGHGGPEEMQIAREAINAFATVR